MENFKIKKKKAFLIPIFRIITSLIILFIVSSCQDVVEVDLETGKERLVIEALIYWNNGTTGNEQTIKITKTASFYSNEINYVSGATVEIKNMETNQVFSFLEEQNGIYKTLNFVPQINATYQLTVTYLDEIFQAESTLLEAPEILSIYQSTEDGFTVEDPEVVVTFQDFENQTDYYRIFFNHHRPINETDYENIDYFIFPFEDSFQEGNIISIFYESEDLIPNDKIDITLYKITERFYYFLNKLEEQSHSGMGPFSLPPVNVKGNIINTSNADNYPYGFFSLNEINTGEYIFQ